MIAAKFMGVDKSQAMLALWKVLEENPNGYRLPPLAYLDLWPVKGWESASLQTVRSSEI